MTIITQQTGSGSRYWKATASSADGTRLVAVANADYIYTSADSGVTWIQQVGSGIKSWYKVACDSTGQYIAASDSPSSPHIYISTDFGVSWIQKTSPNNIGSDIALSSDAAHLASVASSWAVSVSPDLGATWSQASGGGSWTCVALSSNGLKLFAGTAGGNVYISSDGGLSYDAVVSVGASLHAICSDAAGVNLAVAVYGGTIHTSNNGGTTWTSRAGSGVRNWNCISSSADGTHLVAGEDGGYIWISTDSGATWTQQTDAGSASWVGVASSSDGSHVAAAVASGYIWTLVTIPVHTVTFNPNGSPETDMTPQVSSVPATLNSFSYDYPGHTFLNWNTAVDGSGTTYADGAIYDFSADITFYAQWELGNAVFFGGNGATSGSTPYQVAAVPTALEANGFVRTGYTFTGWNTSADGSGTTYADGATYDFSAVLDLYAQWTAIPTHTVTFDPAGGTGEAIPQVSYASENLTTNTATYAGKWFTGWNTAIDGSGTQYVDGAIYDFSADITLYAQWTYTVTFDANGGVETMLNQTNGWPYNLNPNTFTRDGYSFTTWNTLADGSGNAYMDSQFIYLSGDITLYAQWNLNPITTTVTFNANGGTGAASPQSASTPTALTTNTATYSGNWFDGWNTSADGSGTYYPDGATYDFSADITLYAQWSLIPVSKTVIFDANGGVGTMPNQTSGWSYALHSNTFTRSSYTYAGWNTASNGSGTTYADGATYDFSADITLYAQWTAIPVEKPVTIAGALKAVLAITLPDVTVYRIEAPSLTETPVIVIYDGLSVSSRVDILSDLILTETAQVDLYIQTGSDFSLPDAVHKALHRCELILATGQAFLCLVQQRVANPAPGNPNDEGITRINYTLIITRKP